MKWIFEHFGLIVFIIVTISMVRSMRKAMKQAREQQETAADETEEQRNMRRIREGIQRKIAERRGGMVRSEPPPMPAATESVRRTLIPPPLPPVDPFGGPTRRLLAELERRMEPAPPPVTPVPSARTAAVTAAQDQAAGVVRQEQLAEQMRELEEARHRAARRAAEVAATSQAGRDSEAGQLTTSRARLLADLGDTAGLRRALVLREVLGPPVALR